MVTLRSGKLLESNDDKLKDEMKTNVDKCKQVLEEMVDEEMI